MKKEDEILVSIIVPVYNVEDMLPRCIESLINQTYKNLEIVLVNDGSIDNSPNICDFYKERDSRINVIHKKNGGLSHARNSGLSIITGEYVMFVDSDDYLEIDSCEMFIKYLTNINSDITNIDIIVGEAKKIENNKISYFKHTNLIDGQEYIAKEYIKKAIIASEWYAPVCFNMYRKDFLINNSLYFKNGILHEDMQILPRYFLNAKNIMYMKYAFYNYDIREGSITQNKNKQKNIECLMNIYEEWKLIFDNIEEEELQKLLYGILSKQYLYACRAFNITDRRFPKGMDVRFLMKYSLNNKEKLKTLMYSLSPKVYSNLKINR